MTLSFEIAVNNLTGSSRPEPFKFIKFPAVPELGLEFTVGPNGESVQFSCQKPVKGMILDVEGEDCQWSDQCLDLFPGDPQTVKAAALKGRKVKVRFLGDGST
jgi:beta-mannosidase